MNIIKSTDYRFIGIYKHNKPLNWHSFKFAADIDFLSFFIQYHVGLLPIGTIGWIMQQSIEKYCKSILNKFNDIKYSEKTLAKRPFSHNISALWEKINEENINFNIEPAFEDLIKEINDITTDTRYLSSSVATNLGLIETFTLLCCEFRYQIIGSKEFHVRFYGMPKSPILARMFLNFKSFETLFNKLLHFMIEHHISFSGIGVPDSFSWTKVGLEKLTIKFSQINKHKGLERNCPICTGVIGYGTKRSSKDPHILNNYFSM